MHPIGTFMVSGTSTLGAAVTAYGGSTPSAIKVAPMHGTAARLTETKPGAVVGLYRVKGIAQADTVFTVNGERVFVGKLEDFMRVNRNLNLAVEYYRATNGAPSVTPAAGPYQAGVEVVTPQAGLQVYIPSTWVSFSSIMV